MARVNTDILGIRELKGTGMGEFNSDDHYIYYWGQESLRRNGAAIMINKNNLKGNTWMSSQKWQNDLCLFPRQTTQYQVIQAYAPTSNAEDVDVEWFYEDFKDLFGVTPNKVVLFILGAWNVNVGSQETPGIIGLGIRNEAGQIIEFCQENALVIANTLFQQHKRRLYTWTSSDGQHWNQADYILYSQGGEAPYSVQKQTESWLAQIINFLLLNSDLEWRKQEKPLDNSSMT